VRLSKKLAIAAVSTVAAVSVATSAFAYWTTTGSGSGSATAAPSNGTLVLHGSIDTSSHAPYPGGSNPVSFTADNAGATTLFVGDITLASVSVVNAPGVLGTCVVSDFSMDKVTSNSSVATGDGHTIAGTGSLVFANDSGNSQDACKGASITLHLTSN
jgi:hypothetical protein